MFSWFLTTANPPVQFALEKNSDFLWKLRERQQPHKSFASILQILWSEVKWSEARCYKRDTERESVASLTGGSLVTLN